MSVKNFKILTLGTSGAGKTVFLASMFKQLFSQGNAQFNLRAENSAQRKKLNAIYTQLINEESWPEGTRGYSEWTFTCRVQTEDLNNYDACQFTYFDYAGGRLTDEELEPEFYEMIDQADAILCLLDGYKIYKWLHGKESLKNKLSKWLSGKESPEVTNFLEKDLPAILHCTQLSQAPIQFVISKWDILEDQYKLETIRDRLLSIPKFKRVVQERSEAGSIVRLIPVSAVGSKFARLDSSGKMKRIPGRIPEPKQVEVPLACVLPDRLNQLYKANEEQQKLGESSISLTSVAGGIFNFIGERLDVINDTLSYEKSEDITDDILVGVGILSKRFGRFLQKEAKEQREKLETSLKQVKDEQSALTHAIESFLNIQQELLEMYPESELALSSLATTSTESS